MGEYCLALPYCLWLVLTGGDWQDLPENDENWYDHS